MISAVSLKSSSLPHHPIATNAVPNFENQADKQRHENKSEHYFSACHAFMCLSLASCIICLSCFRASCVCHYCVIMWMLSLFSVLNSEIKHIKPCRTIKRYALVPAGYYIGVPKVYCDLPYPDCGEDGVWRGGGVLYVGFYGAEELISGFKHRRSFRGAE